MPLEPVDPAKGRLGELVGAADGTHVDEAEMHDAMNPSIGDGAAFDVDPIEPPPPSFVNREPVLTALTGLIVASLALLAAFGVEFTAEQIAAITGFVAAAYGVFVLFVRNRVTPLADPKIDAEVRLIPETTN